MTVAFRSTWQIPTDVRQQVLPMVRILTRASRTEPGNLAFVPYEDQHESGDVHIFEAYRDPDALVTHQESSYFRACIERATELGVARSRTPYIPVI